ncbi:MAG: hypothetical protein ACRYFS_24185 [Janthinobacterium lividum]
MAYMRGDYYLWDDESGLHIWAKDGYDGWDIAGWHEMDETAEGEPIFNPDHFVDGENTASGVSIHQNIMDEYVMMRIAEMVKEGKVEDAVNRVLDPDGRGGNFGSRLPKANADTLKQALSGLTMRLPPPYDWEIVKPEPKLEER